MSNLILYELQGCPYCAKVKDRFSNLDLEYEPWMVPNIRAKREEIEGASDQTGIPISVDEEHDVKGIPESDNIAGCLEGTYGSAA